MRRRVMVVGVLGLVALATVGCGPSSVVVDGRTSAARYDGPMRVHVDSSDDATVLEQSGAAGLALECRFEPHAGGSGSYTGGLESAQDDPTSALANFLSEEGLSAFLLPGGGYREERDDGHRVLLSYDVRDRTKVAVIVSDHVRDVEGRTGWGVETWAMCDPAELPAQITEERNIGVWTDRDGHRVPVAEVQSFQGAEHCGWEDITYLSLGGNALRPDGTVYLRDTAGELATQLAGRFDAHASRPANATDTGWRRDGRELWLGKDGRAAYLVRVGHPDDVELWPRTTGSVGCA